MKINKKWIKVALSIIGVALIITGIVLFLPTILNVIGYIIELFLPFLLGYIFALAVNPLADLLQKKLKIPRGMSAVLVMVLIIGIVGGILTFLVWKIVDEARTIYTQFPAIYANAQNTMQSVGNKLSVLYKNLPANIQDSFSSIGDTVSGKVAELINTKSLPLVDNASSFAKALPGGFVAVVVFILSSYFMVTDSKAISRNIKKIISPRFAERLGAVKKELKIYLGGYLKAQGILMVIAFVIMLIGFVILDVNFALIIALVIAIIDALPFFGSGLVLWPWIAIAFISGNIKLGIGLTIIYLAVFLVRRFAEPKLVSSGMGMNPILTLMSMYVGYKLISIGGLIVGPIILMFIISLYKAGMFDGIIKAVKDFGSFVKRQFIQFKIFLKNLMESDWEDE